MWLNLNSVFAAKSLYVFQTKGNFEKRLQIYKMYWKELNLEGLSFWRCRPSTSLKAIIKGNQSI